MAFFLLLFPERLNPWNFFFFNISFNIGAAFDVIEKKSDCKSPKIPNQSSLPQTRTIKHERRESRRGAEEPWWERGEELRRHFMKAFSNSYHLWKTQANFYFSDLEGKKASSLSHLFIFHADDCNIHPVVGSVKYSTAEDELIYLFKKLQPLPYLEVHLAFCIQDYTAID